MKLSKYFVLVDFHFLWQSFPDNHITRNSSISDSFPHCEWSENEIHEDIFIWKDMIVFYFYLYLLLILIDINSWNNYICIRSTEIKVIIHFVKLIIEYIYIRYCSFKWIRKLCENYFIAVKKGKRKIKLLFNILFLFWIYFNWSYIILSWRKSNVSFLLYLLLEICLPGLLFLII